MSNLNKTKTKINFNIDKRILFRKCVSQSIKVLYGDINDCKNDDKLDCKDDDDDINGKNE